MRSEICNDLWSIDRTFFIGTFCRCTRIISIKYLIFILKRTKNLREAEAFSSAINSRLRYRGNLITVQSARRPAIACFLGALI